MADENLNDFIKGKRKKIDSSLDRFLPRQGKLAKAMRYSVFAGGKRFRPILCLAAARALNCPELRVLPFACAVEMVHTFTLIHDDLPAMDNSDLRRGQPTNHRVFGEGVAILAGDALNTLAFNIISEWPGVMKILSRALFEVVAGQVSDLESAGAKLTLSGLKKIHGWKTAALLKACVAGVAVLSKASAEKAEKLKKYAEHLGLAFQITDDILDATSTAAEMGKPVKADIAKGFPYLVGIERAKKMAKRDSEKALQALAKFDSRADRLRALAVYTIERGN
jgi:geranylgeranyl diphosphate synthase type II